jgi:hypothetical protein
MARPNFSTGSNNPADDLILRLAASGEEPTAPEGAEMSDADLGRLSGGAKANRNSTTSRGIRANRAALCW